MFYAFVPVVQVSPVLRAEDSGCDLAAVPLHSRSKSHLQEVSAPAPLLQRKGKVPVVAMAHEQAQLPPDWRISGSASDSWMMSSLQEIDEYIVQAKERSYETMVNFGKQGLSIAATAAVSAAVKASRLDFFCFCVLIFLKRCYVRFVTSIISALSSEFC